MKQFTEILLFDQPACSQNPLPAVLQVLEFVSSKCFYRRHLRKNSTLNVNFLENKQYNI